MKKSNLMNRSSAQPTAVIVVGDDGPAVPAMASLLAQLGCDTPVSGQRGNDSIAELNKAILESAGAMPSDWAPFNSGWAASSKATKFRKLALELLRTEFDRSYFSVIHGSGMGRLLPFWNDVFDRAGVTPHYVLVTSEPVELAEILYQGSGIERPAGYLIWLREVLDAELGSRGRPRAYLRTAQLSRNPNASLRSISATLHLKFPRNVQATFAASGFESDELRELVRRREEAREKTPFAPVAPDWVSAANQILADWASNGETRDSLLVLDAIGDAFNEAAPVFLGIGQLTTAQHVRLRELEEQLQKAKDQASTQDHDLLEAKVQGSDVLQEMQEELSARFREIATLTRMLANETATVRRLERTSQRLAAIAHAFAQHPFRRGSRMWLNSILPWGWYLRRTKHSLERERMFDPRAYLSANTDVKNAGVDPLIHYLTHGAKEGRPLGLD